MDHTPGAPKIVIADDNHQNVELLEAYLSDFDCEIRTAHDGEETLLVVEEFEPDLLLLDVMMPRSVRLRGLQKAPRQSRHERPLDTHGDRAQRGGRLRARCPGRHR